MVATGRRVFQLLLLTSLTSAFREGESGERRHTSATATRRLKQRPIDSCTSADHIERLQQVTNACCDGASTSGDPGGCTGLPSKCGQACAPLFTWLVDECTDLLERARLPVPAVGQLYADCQRVLAGTAPPLRALGAGRLLVGTAANIGRIQSGEHPRYAAVLAKEFSILTPENCMKMTFTQPTNGRWDFADADALVSWAAHRGKKIRGHNLIWTGRNPQWLSELAPTLSPVELDRVMSTHIKTTAGHFAGQVYSWDVVNEAIENNVTPDKRCGPWNQGGWTCWLKTSSHASPVDWNRTDAGDGTTYIERAFRRANKADPAAKLFYNEYGIHTLGTSPTSLTPFHYSLVVQYRVGGRHEVRGDSGDASLAHRACGDRGSPPTAGPMKDNRIRRWSIKPPSILYIRKIPHRRHTATRKFMNPTGDPRWGADPWCRVADAYRRRTEEQGLGPRAGASTPPLCTCDTDCG
jgi:hypothetical protein